MMRRLCDIVAVTLTLSSPAFGQAAPSPTAPSPMVWERLKIGSGGFAMSLDIANDGTRTMYTDISQGYIWRTGDTQWRPCITESSLAKSGYTFIPGLYFGPWAMAIAPSNSQRIYLLYGAPGRNLDTKLFKSDDGCKTLTMLKAFPGTTANPVGASRISGQRIAVDPNNPDVVYVGSTNGNVYRTINGGNTFSIVPGIAGTSNELITSGSAIDGKSGTATLDGVKVSRKLYIASHGLGIWASTDGGNAFKPIAGGLPSITTKFSTSQPNSVVIVGVQAFGQTRGAISDTAGLKWDCSRVNNAAAGGGWFVSQCWAYAPSIVTTDVTVSFNGYTARQSYPSVQIFSITGADVSGPTPFDMGKGMPRAAKASPLVGSTTSTNTLVFTRQIAWGGATTATQEWTCIKCVDYSYSEYRQFTSAQANISPVAPGSTNRGGWIDAVRAASPGSASVDVAGMVTNDQVTVPTTPTQVVRGQISCNGTYYATENTARGWKWADETWTHLLPTSNNAIFGIYPHPTECDKIFVPVGGRFTTYNQSVDAGKTWVGNRSSVGAGSGATVTTPNIGWFRPTFAAPATPMNSLDAGDAKYNPVTGRLEMATGLCYYLATPPFTLAGMNYEEMCPGAESVVPLTPKSVPGGNVFFGATDVGMFVNLNTKTYPSYGLPLMNYIGGLNACWDIQYSGQNPKYIYALCNENIGLENSGYSTNGGLKQSDWKRFGGSQNPYTPPGTNVPPVTGGNYGGSIAPNACDTSNVIILQNTNASKQSPGKMYRTTNALATPAVTWTQVDQAFSFSPPLSRTGDLGWGTQYYIYGRRALAADYVKCDTFYAYNELSGVYRSIDKGETWTRVFTGKLFTESGNMKLRAVPGKAGELYAATGFVFGPQPVAGSFLRRSTDGGATWNNCPGVLGVNEFGFGKGPPSSPNDPSIFIIGYVNGTHGIWRSDNNCQTWTNLTSAGGPQPPGDEWIQHAATIGGDMNEYGKVYIGMGTGSGFVQGTLQSPNR